MGALRRIQTPAPERLCGSVCEENMNSDFKCVFVCPWGPGKRMGSLEPVVIGICETPGIGPGVQTLVFMTEHQKL